MATPRRYNTYADAVKGTAKIVTNYDDPNYRGPTKEEDEAVGWEPEPYREISLELGPGPVFDPDDIPMPPHNYNRPAWMNADNPEFQRRKQAEFYIREARAAMNLWDDDFEDEIWPRRRG